MLRDEIYAPPGLPDWLVSWPPVWSADGSAMACRLTSRAIQKECVAVDGRRGEEFDRVGMPALSRDGKRVAYRAHQGERSFVVVGLRRGPEVELMTDPAISADGRVVAYAARLDGRWRILVDGREIAVEAQPSHVFLSDDGRSVGWQAGTGSDGAAKVRVVVNGIAGAPFTLVGRPVFSPDGRRVAYAADDGTKQYIVIDDAKVEVSGRLSDPAFSPDGKQVGYGARAGRELWWKVLDVP